MEYTINKCELQPIIIVWRDARLFHGSYSIEDAKQKDMLIYESIGYMLSQDDLITRIAHEKDSDGELRDITLIPTGSVINILELKPKRKE